MRIGLLITQRCNAACTHCATSCGPDKTQSLTKAQIIQLMDDAAAIDRREADNDLEFSISGGEPFLDFPMLVEIVRHGALLGGIVSCQTNAYWASNEQKAQHMLQTLKEAGLRVLGVSISQFHDEFVRRARVERACRVARSLGITTIVKCALTTSDTSSQLEDWAKGLEVDGREIFPIQPYLREGAQLPDADYKLLKILPTGRCPSAVLTVRENGKAYTCCMPGGFNEFLSLGNIHNETLDDMHRLFYVQGKQQILRKFGPIHFAEEIIRRGQGHRLRNGYTDVCDLCSHVTSDPEMASVAEELSVDLEVSQLKSVFSEMASKAS